MDPDILQQKNVIPRNPRKAKANDFELKIGTMATLLRSPGKAAHGIVYQLTHAEVYALYWGGGLDAYASEAIMIEVDGKHFPALCCNLVTPPKDNEENPEYANKLKNSMKRLGLL
jgi:hypothetical protein